MHFSAPGKVMLTGEYAVLKGSLSFALPSKLHQHLHHEPRPGTSLHWLAKDAQGNTWLEAFFPEPNLLGTNNHPETAERLLQLLQAATTLGAVWPTGQVTTSLDFERTWGLGSSSTLVALVAHWLRVDPWKLFDATQNGSGYDLAVALCNQPLLYRFQPERTYQTLSWRPNYTDQLYFLPLGHKQVSSAEVSKHKNLDLPDAVRNNLDACTHALIDATSLQQFGEAAQRHEDLLANWLTKEPIASSYPAGPYVIKSLGAWGGDLALVIPTKPTSTAMLENNLGTPLLPWNVLMHELTGGKI